MLVKKGTKVAINEHEIRVLEINTESILKKLEKLGATKIFDSIQKRLVYDFNPINPNKWIRLRNNGKKTTLAVKEILDNSKVAGTRESEVEVSDFNEMKNILQELGYTPRNYQENKRIQYMLNNTEICIDSWPLIPTYMEIEGENENDIYDSLKKLGLENGKVTTLDVSSIYKNIYNIDWKKIKELKFSE